MHYIRNVETGAVLATGSLEDELWRLTFLDEQTLPNLSAAEFSPTSETHRFSVRHDPLQLVYDYSEHDRRLTMTVDVLPLDHQRFDLRASITNESRHRPGARTRDGIQPANRTEFGRTGPK